MTQTLLETRDLTVRFGGHVAVDHVTCAFKAGELTAIVGPNGAGKTTLMRMLATLARPDAGTAQVMGHDLVAAPDAVRGAIAMTGQFASLDEDLTGQENLVFLARLWGFGRKGARRRAEDLLAAFELTEARHRQVKDYSGGMRRRLDIAASLIVTPGVLFLDEPTTGLDVTARRAVWNNVRRLAAAGTTVVLTTHYLEEAEQLCDRIGVIDQGRMVADGPRDTVVKALQHGRIGRAQ